MTVHFVAADRGVADIFENELGKPYKLAIVAWRIATVGLAEYGGETHVSPVYEGDQPSTELVKLGRLETDGTVTGADGVSYRSWAAFKFIYDLPEDERILAMSGAPRPGGVGFLVALVEAMKAAEKESV
jgi:hypothetical protein